MTNFPEVRDGGVPRSCATPGCQSTLRPDDRPHIMPMHDWVVGEAINLRTAPDSGLGRQVRGATSFVVYHVDDSCHRDSSVAARAMTETVENHGEVADIHATWEPGPWAGGEPSQVTSPDVVRGGQRRSPEYRGEVSLPWQQEDAWSPRC